MDLYSVSWLAVCMSFAVEMLSVSYPEALMTLTFACFGWGFSCMGVCLSMCCGGLVSGLDGSLLSASASVFLSAGM